MIKDVRIVNILRSTGCDVNQDASTREVSACLLPPEAVLTRSPDRPTRERDDLLRQETVWLAAPPPRRPSATARAVALARAVGAVLTFAVWLVGIPVALVIVVGWPVPRRLPSGRELLDALSQPDLLTEQNFLQVAAALIWLIWGLSIAYTAYALAALAPSRSPRIPVPRLVRRIVTGLVGSVSVTATGQVASVAAPPAVTATAHDVEAPSQSPQPSAGAAVQSAPKAKPNAVEHPVVRGDTLWDIADEHLDDPNRWDDIYDINKGRPQPDGRALRDPDLIQPGWRLTIPTDPAPATPTPPEQIPEDPAPVPTESPTPAPATATTPPSALTDARRDVRVTSTDERGIELSDGSWIPWALAGALATVAAAVWRQRRRRYTGNDVEDAPTMPPPALAAIGRAAARAKTRRPADGASGGRIPVEEETAAQGSGTPQVTALVGDGRLGVARSAMTQTLTTPASEHTELRGEVVTDQASLAAMLGPFGSTVGGWARLHIAVDIDEAVSILETRLLHRARILDTQETEEAPPPLLFICTAPHQSAQPRLNAILGQGLPLGASALLLGDWPAAETLNVTSDGTVRGTGSLPPSRVAVLTARTANEAINAVREAQTGEAATTPATPDFVPIAASRTQHSSPAALPVSTVASEQAAAPKARLRVLGPPGIDDINRPGRPLRAKALEVAVLLACHPDGLTTRDIGEHVEPDAKLKQADERVHTNISNLKHVFGRASGKRTKAYVIRANGRYQLDRDTVDIDLWELRDLLRNAAIANHGTRRRQLEAACALYTAPLAASTAYDWIQPHREAVRRWGTEAHLQLGELLLADDPSATSGLMDKAIALDRFNEALYRLAMRARHALNDTESVTTLLHALTRALAEIDAMPDQETTELARRLQAR
ncbi:LysM peptidoglycan-binding domain-containing protein [Asanoa sp. NPDC049518]|uniref:LysM peptidoglycan-binding domain-containing protein n=1 Tax=unclassified Asanoa TaxID=2685164 RepID=UPI0034375609